MQPKSYPVAEREADMSKKAIKRPTRFTDKFVRSLSKKDVRYEVREQKGEPGSGTLAIRVSPTGSKTWIFSYRTDRPRRMTLGKFPTSDKDGDGGGRTYLTVADANLAVAEARKKLQRGEDPGAEAVKIRVEERDAHTVEDVVREYVARYAKRNKKSWRSDERLLESERCSDFRVRERRAISFVATS